MNSVACSECRGTRRVQDPFAGPGEMMPCQCVDQPELDALARQRDALPFGRADLEELLGAMDRAAAEHEASAADLKVPTYREWERGAAFGYRCVAEMLRKAAGLRAESETADESLEANPEQAA